jgi:ELWxxDGT repeat protein
MGGGGDDRITGGPGRDLLVGSDELEPDFYEFNTRYGILDRNDTVTLAAELPAIRAGSTIEDLNFDLDDNGDWYIISSAEAIRRFGDASGALLTGDMIEVAEMVDNEGTLVPTGNLLRAYLFAAEDVDEGEGLNLVPRERFSGVPDYYLLHVTTELAPSAANAGRGLELDGVIDPNPAYPMGSRDAANCDTDKVVAIDTNLNIRSTLTVELWFKAAENAGQLDFGGGKDWMPILYKGDEEAAPADAVKRRTYSLWLNKAGYLHFTAANATTQDAVVNTAAGSIKAGEWYHFAGVLDRPSGQMRAYLNGVLVGTSIVGGTASADNSDDPLLMGATFETSTSYTPFKGVIDEVRIWNTARSETDIQHGHQRVLKGSEEGLVGYWRFEETEGNTAANLVKGGGAGTVMTGGSPVLRPAGRELILPFKPGRYEMRFKKPLGETLHVPAGEAIQNLSSVELGGQPVVIPLGDINGDGFDDAVVSVRDLVLDGTGFRNFARIAFGTASGLTLDPNADPNDMSPPITLELPAPVLAGDGTNRSVVSGAGDVDGDGLADIAVSVTSTDGNRIYILFGRTDWSGTTTADAGLFGEYFILPAGVSSETFPDFDVLTPAHTRVDSQVSFPLTTGYGFAGYGDLSDRFAIRWIGQILIENEGGTRFYLASDDGSRLYIDDQLVVDNGGLHAYRERSALVDLEAGYHDVRLEYFENYGAAGVVLSWDPVGPTAKESVPSSVLFRDARDVVNVVTDRDLELTGFSSGFSAAGPGDVTPMIGSGILGEYYVEPSLESLSFDGIDDFVEVDSSESLDIRETITIEARFKVDGFSGGTMPLIQKSVGGVYGRTYAVWLRNDGSIEINVADGKDINWLISPSVGGPSIVAGQWQEFAGVIDLNAGRMEIYLNGETVATGPTTLGAALSHKEPLLIGGTPESFAGLSPFHGVIDEVAIWSGVRSNEQIQADFANGMNGGEKSLAAYWRFNETKGDVVVDATVHHNDGLLGAGTPEYMPVRVQGQLHEFPNFDLLEPDFSRIEADFGFSDYDGGFAGIPELDDLFAARWTGQVYVEESGPVTFAVAVIGEIRLYVDGSLVAEAGGDDAYSYGLGTTTLVDGLHEIRLEYITSVGPSLAALGWDLSGSGILENVGLIPGESYIRTDATADDPGAHGFDDLLVADKTGVRMIHGRSRVDWESLVGEDGTENVSGMPRFFTSGLAPAISGVGDFNGDDRDDFAVMLGSNLRIYRGGGLPQSVNRLLPMITDARFAGLSLEGAGDIDGDTLADILITGPTNSFVVLGKNYTGMVPSSVTLTSLLGAEPRGAIELPDGVFRAVGDFDGDGLDDLGAATFVSTDKLNEGGELEHQVVEIFLGADRDLLAERFADSAGVDPNLDDPVPDAIIEPGRASFVGPGSTKPQALYFGPLGEVVETGGQTHTLLGVSGPAGDSLRVYDGTDLAPADETLPATGVPLAPELFQWQIADPTAPGFFQTLPPGVDLANDAAPSVRDAFGLEGTSENERLSQAVSLADFNGDGVGELLVSGEKESYLLLGPVELDDLSDIADIADVIIDADIGRPAIRMGDVTGDGLDDLVFYKPATSTTYKVTIIAGGNAGGIELPRTITQEWITSTLAMGGQQRLRVREGETLAWTAFDGSGATTAAVLNWNDDGKADVALVGSASELFVGTILSGEDLWTNVGLINPDIPENGGESLALIVFDTTDRDQVATEMLGAPVDADDIPYSPNIRMTVAGDVNGDGLDDLLLADSGFFVFPSEEGAEDSPTTSKPNIGRAYLILGQSDDVTSDDRGIWLGARSELIIQDFSLGGSVAALGDLNHDGYDDFAVGSTAEGRRANQADTTREGGLFIFLGKADFGFDAAADPAPVGENADIIVTRDFHENLPEGVTYNGALRATAGDFNGDGLVDLAVGEPNRVLTSTGTNTILDQDQSGTLRLFYSATEGGRTLALTAADAQLRGEFEFDSLGVLPSTPGFDLDLDGIDDLVIGAPGADVVELDVLPGAGKVYAAYGSSSRSALPPSAQEIGNRSFTGSGFFLVDNGTGRAEVFKDAPGTAVDKLLFTLLAGESERWYRFTTLGDGMPGNSIRIVPGAFDSFLAPVDPDDSSALVDKPVEVGNSLYSRSTLDTASGGLFLGEAFTLEGRLTGWSLYSGSFTGTRLVTPVIFKDAGGGRFKITGIGLTRTITANDVLSFTFGLQSGRDTVGPDYFLGWKDGSVALDNSGVISYDTGGDPVRWFGNGQGAAGSVEAGRSLAPLGTFNRTYSISANVTTGAVLEFDLGRFLGWAGDAEGVGSATLVLHAPDATEPVLAPVSPYSLTFSGGKLFFTAYDDRGRELWVTDGTVQGTRFVKDLKPGSAGAYPYNLIDVGGTLYFTANDSALGTKLYRSDGTPEGTVEVADLASQPYSFTAQLGTAVLEDRALTGPSNGRPAVDTTFTVEILRADGTTNEVPVTLTRAATETNIGILGTNNLLQDFENALNSALTAAGFAGQVTVASNGSGTILTLTAAAADIVRLTVSDATILGFAADQASQPSVVLDAGTAAPTDGKLLSDLDFNLEVKTVGGAVTVLDLGLSASATGDNTAANDLAADLQSVVNTALGANGFANGAVQVSIGAGKLRFAAGDPGIIELRINGADLPPGYSVDQVSVRSVSVTTTGALPASGRLNYDLHFDMRVLTSSGTTLTVPMAVTGAATAGNTILENLRADVQSAVNAALAGAGITGNPVTVATVGTRLRISAASPILSLEINGAEALGFTEGTDSTRSGDRVWFVAYDGTRGTELWKVEGDVMTPYDLAAGTSSSYPGNLLDVNGTLYFSAGTGTSGTGELWRSVNGSAPVKVAGQTFVNPRELIRAGDYLVFSAQPSAASTDREVFSYGPLSATPAFVKISGITDTNNTGGSSAANLTYFDGKVFFSAADGLDGETYHYNVEGRELYAATPGVTNSAVSPFANIGQPDTWPYLVPIFGAYIFNPGSVVSSSPSDLEALGSALYFTATNGSSGREVWKTDGVSSPAMVKDIVSGSGSSSPYQYTLVQTSNGPRVFFSADGGLWITDGTSVGTTQIKAGTVTWPYSLVAFGDKLYFTSAGALWSTDGTEEGTVKFDRIIPDPVPIQVRVLAGEGDGVVTSDDFAAPAVLTVDTMIGSEPVEVDITSAVKEALARGDTRLTVRVENPLGEKAVTLELAGTLREGRTGLKVTSTVPGLKADLYAADGPVVALGKSTIDLRAIESGTYYLRVYTPCCEAGEANIPFIFEADAPVQGYVHPLSDRDRIRGGDGDDLIVGNEGLDRLWGESGRDDFVAEAVEVHDFDEPAGETRVLPPGSERSTIPPEGPPVDASIIIADRALRVALAEAVGIPVTTSYLGTPLIHV